LCFYINFLRNRDWQGLDFDLSSLYRRGLNFSFRRDGEWGRWHDRNHIVLGYRVCLDGRLGVEPGRFNEIMLDADLSTLNGDRRLQWLSRFRFSLYFHIHRQLWLGDFLLNLNAKLCSFGGRRGDMDGQRDNLLHLRLTTELRGRNWSLDLGNRIHSRSKELRCEGLRLPNERSWSGFLERSTTS
jgi:hypothetical protein